MQNHFNTSVLIDGHFYGFHNNMLKCIEAATGRETWAERGLGRGSLIYADGDLIVLGERGQLLLVEATPDAYRERARTRVFDARTWTMPSLSEGRLYVRSQSELVALDVRPHAPR